VGEEIRLQASGFIKDISINMLSDDNFSEVQLNYLTTLSLFSRNYGLCYCGLAPLVGSNCIKSTIN
jgi:hypothetical protein